VFSTKNRAPFLRTKEVRFQVFKHIKVNAKEKGVWLDSINGYKEHAHCLISLGKGQTISKVTQLIKGESSFWINRNNLIRDKFLWQDDFWAVSVSESHVQAARTYIRAQEKHHKRQSFTEEVAGFMEKYGWQYVQE